MAENVITLWENFTLVSRTGSGDGPWHTPWVLLPPGCTKADFVMRCVAHESGTAKLELQTGMDGTTAHDVTDAALSAVSFTSRAVDGLGLRVRGKLSVQSGPVELIVSAYVIPKLV